MSIEAMKLALDCLEDIFGKDKIDVCAINALRQAIAEAEKHLTRTTTPQREWVGLTVREIEWCFYDANDARIVAARSIEAKLKEKNGG